MFGHYLTSYQAAFGQPFKARQEAKPAVRLTPVPQKPAVKTTSDSDKPVASSNSTKPEILIYPSMNSDSKPTQLFFNKIQNLQPPAEPLTLIEQTLNKIPKTNPYTSTDAARVSKECFSHNTFVFQIRNHFKNSKNPFSKSSGFCGGLTTMWLYTAGIKNQVWFNILKKSLMSDIYPSNFASDRNTFMSVVNFWQDPVLHLPNLYQGALNILFKIPMRSNHSTSDEQLFDNLKAIKPDDLVYIRSLHGDGQYSGNHTIGITYDGKTYSLFDCNYKNAEPKSLHTFRELALEVKERLLLGHANLPLLINISPGAELRPKPLLMEEKIELRSNRGP